MVAFVGTSVETSRANVADSDAFRVRAAAQNAASIAIADIWGDFEAIAQGQEQLWRLRTHLESQGMSNQSEAVNPKGSKYIDSVGLAANKEGRFEIDGVEIERLDVYRVDNWDSTDIVIEVDAVTRRGKDGSTRERRSSIQEVFQIAAPEWDGLDYALLANNINCLLCHTNIDSAERFYNTNGMLAGSFDSVKVGTIESIHFRADPDSKVAGVMLIGADALLGDGHEISDWSAFNLEGAAPSAGGSVEKIMEDIFGNALYGGLDIFDPNSPSSSANMFLDFYENIDLTDYNLPTSFPSPFPDDGGYDPATGQPRTDLADNGVIDDTEFYSTVLGSNGKLAGGDISVIPYGDKIDRSNEWAAMKNGSDPSISGITQGNVYLHGTKNDPIILDGQVAIDGDVIISGYVKGSGSIKARGNVYIPGDVLYADGGSGTSRTYGMASDGTENSLAIAAGGNIVMGDYFHRAWGKGDPADGTTSGSFNFTMDELAIFNRMEWIKTQPTLPGKSEYIQTGEKTVEYPETTTERYQQEVPTYKWVPNGEKTKKWYYKNVTTSNGLPAPYTKTTTTRVKDYFVWVDKKVKVQSGTRKVWKTRTVNTGRMLTRIDPIMAWVTPQVDNPKYNSLHTPRYYSFSEDTKVPIFNKKGYFDPATEHWVSDERAGNDDGTWDTSKLTIANPDNTRDSILYNPDRTPKAVISSIGPKDGWISEEVMADVIHHALNGKPGGDKTFEVNATLYSANAIIGMTPGSDTNLTNGKLHVNGGIVAADVGLLAPMGTQVNYDGRGARALSITADSGLVITRRLSAPRMRQ
ncbi:hypothetical protein [Planctomycetes bacterium Poly30]